MNEECNDKRKDQKNWLKEHNSIQIDLFKMKDEFLSEKEPAIQTGDKGEERIPSGKEDPPTSERPARSPKEAITERNCGELTIKQLLGEKTEGKTTTIEKKQSLDPPRMAGGQIPASPDLSGKIANVLLLEDRLKRRKFELEMRAEGKKAPPPPTNPIQKEREEGEEDWKGTTEEAVRKRRDKDRNKKGVMNTRASEMGPDMRGKPAERGRTENVRDVREDRSLEDDRVRGDGKKKKKKRGIMALFGR